MTDLFKELLGFYKEKTKLPIVSTYIILLIVWNWDILSIYLFSSVNMETRVCWIKNIVPGFWDHVFRVLVPALISFAYPFITEWLMYIIEKKLKNIRYSRQDLKNNTDILYAKAQFIIANEQSGKRDLDELNEQLRLANEKRDLLSQALRELENTKRDQEQRFAEDKISLSKEIKEHEDRKKEYTKSYHKFDGLITKLEVADKKIFSKLFNSFVEHGNIEINQNSLSVNDYVFKMLINENILVFLDDIYFEDEQIDVFKFTDYGSDLLSFYIKIKQNKEDVPF